MMKHVDNEVRVKLHIASNEVKNLWICLCYDQRPTISHVIEYIKKHHGSIGKDQNQESDYEVKLYLDNFWLPPYESSRLIRENDCVK